MTFIFTSLIDECRINYLKLETKQYVDMAWKLYSCLAFTKLSRKYPLNAYYIPGTVLHALSSKAIGENQVPAQIQQRFILSADSLLIVWWRKNLSKLLWHTTFCNSMVGGPVENDSDTISDLMDLLFYFPYNNNNTTLMILMIQSLPKNDLIDWADEENNATQNVEEFFDMSPFVWQRELWKLASVPGIYMSLWVRVLKTSCFKTTCWRLKNGMHITMSKTISCFQCLLKDKLWLPSYWSLLLIKT